jgi:DNA topoisomerase-1
MRLVIAEKAIAAKRIAEILASKEPRPIKHGSVYVYDIGDDTLVVPLKGHVLDVDYPREYSNWRSANLYQLVDAPVVYKPIADVVGVLKDYAKGATRCTIATDFDTEGESIGREAVTILAKSIPVDRARFSAITPEEVREAFAHLAKLDGNLADSADARREVDLIWGAVLTRFISLASGRLGHEFLSVGRVQTPTLALIVDREKERRAFKPEPFWVISAIFHKTVDFEGVHEAGEFQERPGGVFEKIKDEKKARVESLDKKKRELNPPTPFNTTDFLRAAAGIGISPSRAMQLAESLYMSGFISYPRTDNTVYPESIRVKDVVKKFTAHPVFAKHAGKILAQKKITPTEGRKRATDHPPIYPVELANRESLDPAAWKVYELVVRRFFSTLAPKAELELTRAVLDVKGEKFVATGQVMLVPGWKEFYPYSKTSEVELPPLSTGELVEIKALNLEEKMTQPPKQYSPAALIKAMEDLNLGTKSTRPEIIKKLIDRKYVVGTKAYEPTPVAFAVVDALEKHVSDITSPEMTSKLEGEMEGIASGAKKKDVVVRDSRVFLGQVLTKMNAAREGIGAELRKAALQTVSAGACPRCGSEMRVIVSRKTRKRFVGCSGYPKCSNSYPLPQKGRVEFLGTFCDKCGAPRIKVTGRRPYEMCLNMNCETKADWKKPAAAAVAAPGQGTAKE